LSGGEYMGERITFKANGTSWSKTVAFFRRELSD
jgi:hypothetical protein